MEIQVEAAKPGASGSAAGAEGEHLHEEVCGEQEDCNVCWALLLVQA